MPKNSALLFSAIRICAIAIVLSAGLHFFSEKIYPDFTPKHADLFYQDL